MTPLGEVRVKKYHEEMQAIYSDIVVVIKQSLKSAEQIERKHDKAKKKKVNSGT